MKTIVYKNTKIDYNEFGEGLVIVLLHGFYENKEMWNAFIPQLSKNYKVVTIDLLGHGKTDCLGYIHTMETQAEMVHHVLNNLMIEKAVIIGHSMGGYVALAFAELFPKFINGLVLINSTSIADSSERVANRDRAIIAVKKNYTACVKMSIANLFGEEKRKTLLKEIEYVKTEALKTPLQGIIACQEGMKIRKDRTFILKNNELSILLILGKKDPVLNYEDTLEIIKNTSVKLCSLPDGHMSHIENKEELSYALEEYLSNLINIV